jgi:hypothetical protein
MSGPVSIGDLMRAHRLLWVYCNECGRERDVDPSTLPLPGDYPVPKVANRIKCSACGSRKITTLRMNVPAPVTDPGTTPVIPPPGTPGNPSPVRTK